MLRNFVQRVGTRSGFGALRSAVLPSDNSRMELWNVRKQPFALAKIKARIQSCKSLGDITETMKNASSAKQLMAEDQLKSIQEFAAVMQVVDSGSDKPASRPDPEDNFLCIVIGTDRGLCGPYNKRLMEQMETFQDERQAPGVTGRSCFRGMGEKIITDAGGTWEFDRAISDYRLLEDPSFQQALEVSSFILADVEYDKGIVCYMGAEADDDSGVNMREIPAAAAETDEELAATGGDDEEFEWTQKPEAFSDWRLKGAFPADVAECFTQFNFACNMYAILQESVASEEKGRVQAMNAASDTSKEQAASLELVYNKKRQEGITTEILELSAGALALASSGDPMSNTNDEI